MRSGYNNVMLMIRFLTGKTMLLFDIALNMTIEEVKEHIMNRLYEDSLPWFPEGIISIATKEETIKVKVSEMTKDDMRLIFNGKPMDNKQTVADYGIPTSTDTLHCLFRLKKTVSRYNYKKNQMLAFCMADHKSAGELPPASNHFFRSTLFDRNLLPLIFDFMDGKETAESSWQELPLEAKQLVSENTHKERHEQKPLVSAEDFWNSLPISRKAQFFPLEHIQLPQEESIPSRCIVC